MRTNLALSDGMAKANAEQGELIVMDIDDNSVVGHASLKIHDGEGGFVFRSSKVKEVTCTQIIMDKPQEYLDTKVLQGLPLSIIMPAVSNIYALMFGAKPTDGVTGEENTTLDGLFLKGHHEGFVNGAEEFIGYDTLMAICYHLGFINQSDVPAHLLQRMRQYPLVFLGWINELAQGCGVAKVFQSKTDESPDVRHNIMCLQRLLRQYGTDLMSKTEGELHYDVSGYTYVSLPDCHHFRDIAFCGYFPTDKPKYSVLVWLKSKEESEELLGLERPELGLHAAQSCRHIVDFIMSRDT